MTFKYSVDIVTPVYGQPEFLEQMVKSVLETEPGCNWQMWLVDDVSPNPEAMGEVYRKLMMLDHKRIHVVKNDRNSGFAMTCNNGASRGKYPFVLLLNSDVIANSKNWLREMVNTIAQQGVGVVGAKLLFFENCEDPKRPAGKVQHAGVAFNLLGQPYHIFLGWSPHHPKVHCYREMNAVTGACLLTHRSLYERLGGLDKDYKTGNFEDVQYCLQVRASGLKVIYQPEAVLYHFAGGSNNTATARFNETLFRIKCNDLISWDEWKFW